MPRPMPCAALAPTFTIVVTLAACADTERGTPGAGVRSAVEAVSVANPDSSPTPRGTVDSTRSPAEELQRFREGLGGAPARLAGGDSTRDALVRAFAAAIAAHDTSALRALHLTRREFAYFYYPSSRYVKPPFELPPALVWFQLEQASEKGIVRVLRRLGGRSLSYRGHSCESAPEVLGRNRIWKRCTVTLGDDDTALRRVRLFGSIIERDGTYKFVSYANDY